MVRLPNHSLHAGSLAASSPAVGVSVRAWRILVLPNNADSKCYPGGEGHDVLLLVCDRCYIISPEETTRNPSLDPLLNRGWVR